MIGNKTVWCGINITADFYIGGSIYIVRKRSNPGVEIGGMYSIIIDSYK